MLLAGSWEPDRLIARAAVLQAEAEVEQIRTEIDRATVRSPIDGDVLQVNVRAGEQVNAQPMQPLMVLGNLSRLHVRADISEHDIPSFDRAGRVLARLRRAPEREFPLKYVRVEPYVVAKRSLTGNNAERVDTRVLQVIYSIDELADAMFVGQQVDVFIESAGTAEAKAGQPAPRVAKVRTKAASNSNTDWPQRAADQIT